MTTATVFQHLRLPVIASPMFIVSGPELVSLKCVPASSAASHS